ncbi:MAG: TonB-dependent receptor plug domain-containing protein, partial [Massilia sp.]|nr:TonB-dependent receptor plug domain-containing protein [Massilia sp.]
MIETVMSRSLRLIFASGAAGLALAGAPAQAQEDQNQPMPRVEITGSSIKRLAAETSLPITTIRAGDFVKQGLTTAQEVLQSIPMNQTSTSSSQSVGAGTGGRAVADLRGLGGDKTLVLLNGRRLANHPYFADTVDLNIIPVAALDRVEVLRDGASAIYGTDAIGGVINFITKRSVIGSAITFEAFEPIRSGGGAEQRLNLSGGYGDLNADGYNMFG